uniref:Uncharacterized protein n=1 Tax=Arundo donax TaxID=35708 RepID=A0A0A9H1S9_ARUDO
MHPCKHGAIALTQSSSSLIKQFIEYKVHFFL